MTGKRSRPKRYSTSGICTCKPWKSSSFCLFGTYYTEDKEGQIKFCPWCGNSLIRRLDDDN